MSPASLLEEMVLPARPLEKFSQRLGAQLTRLERKMKKAVPQLARRKLTSNRVMGRP